MNFIDKDYLFWSLPYGMRQYIFRLARKEEYNKLNSLFTTPNSDGVSWRKMKELKFVFVHVPKTGGLSLCSILQGSTINKHATARRFQLLLSKKEFEEYFKFAIVRNPWDRLVSAYLYLKKGGITATDRRVCEEQLSAFSSFDSFVENYIAKKPDHKGLYIHFIPQYKFICDHKGNLLVDYLGRFETYTESYNHILEKIGIQSPEVREENVNKNRKHYREYYTRKTRQIVEDIYRKDIELLSYTF